MNASIYATIVIMTSNSKYYKAIIAEMVKTTLIANLTVKESNTVLFIVSIFAIVAMYYLKLLTMISGQYF